MYTHVYTIAQTAQCFFPDSDSKNALRRFRYLLQSDRLLWQELIELHYKPYQRIFTPKQYDLIVKYLGSPL